MKKSEELDKFIAGYIKSLRERLGLNQKDFGQAIGLSRKTGIVCRYESGQVKPGLEVCHKIVMLCEKYGIKGVTIKDLRPDICI